MYKDFKAVVFHSCLAEKQSSCLLKLDGKYLIAKGDFEDIALDLHQSEFLFGGKGKRLLYIRPSLTKHDPVFVIQNRSFLNYLKENADQEIREKLKNFSQKMWYQKFAIPVFFMFIILLIVSLVRFIFSYGVDFAVEKIPHSVDREIGKAAFRPAIQKVAPGGKILKNAFVQKNMDKILKRLEDGAHGKFKFSIYIVDSATPNAFALPGGKMVVFTGLLKEAKSYEEVAGVIAHEMSHVIHRHGMKQLIRTAGVGLVIQCLFGNTNGRVILENSANLFQLKFSRDMEREADATGFQLLKNAGIHPAGLEHFLENLKIHQAQYRKNVKFNIGWLSTHPETGERISLLKKKCKEMKNFIHRPLKINWKKVQESLKKH